MADISTDAVINSIRIKEQASDPATPATDYWQLYPKAAGLYLKDDAGSVLGPLLAGDGKTGGQTLIGGIAANDDLILEGTSHSTRTSSYLILQPNGGKVGIGTSTPASHLHIYEPLTNAELRIEAAYNEPAAVAQIRLVTAVDNWVLGTSTEGGSFSITSGGGGISFNGNGDVLCRVMQLFNSDANNQTPTLYLSQYDDDISFIEFDVSSSTPGAGKPIDTAAIGTYYGKVRVFVTNVGAKYIPLYNS